MTNIKALKIIKENTLFIPKTFGEIYFKGQDILMRNSNVNNNGSRTGVGAWFSAGRILKKLESSNLIFGGKYSVEGGKYTLTTKGLKYLSNYDTKEEDGK